MSGEVKDESRLTSQSWRSQFYGLSVEGRKLRVTNRAVKASAWIFGITVAAVQLYSAFRPSFKRSTEVLFAPIQIRADLDSIYVPAPMDSKREAENEQLRRSKSFKPMRAQRVEPIKLISLSGTDGIPAGSEVIAQLGSGGANGMIKAMLIEPLRSQGEILLPRGTILLGKGSSNDDRLYVTFRRAISPDRTPIKINAIAYDEKDRIIGLKGKKVSDYAFKLAASAGLIFLGGVADGMREDGSANPFAARRPTMRDAALNGVTTSTSNVSRDVLDSMKNSGERVIVQRAARLVVIFGEVDATD